MELKPNKVEVGGDVIVDLTQDTVTPAKLAAGATAHDASGNTILGTAVIPVLNGEEMLF